MSDGIKTVTEQIYLVIRNDILQQKRKMGEKLTVKQLQDQLGVSSTPIREALTRLQQDGLIEYQPNVGMRVVTMDERDLREIFQLMTEFDCIAMRLACQSPERAEMLRRLTHMQETAAQCLRGGDLEKWEELSDAFHLEFYHFCNNGRLRAAAAKNRLQFGIFSNAYQHVEENQQAIQNEHDEILKYLMNNEDGRAIETLRKHAEASMEKASRYLASVKYDD